jgi:hypothetical protein
LNDRRIQLLKPLCNESIHRVRLLTSAESTNSTSSTILPS